MERAALTQSGGDRSYSSCSRAALLNGYCVLGGEKNEEKKQYLDAEG